MDSNHGDAPGVVKVPAGTKGSPANAPSDGTSTFGEPSRTGGNMPGATVGKDNLGAAPGVVRVPTATRGSHPANRAGRPSGKSGQGHSKYGG